ncbi:hypothetical protein K2Y11_03465 [bacterium]|nr:hypothetical protein [bacterium]
MPTTAFLSPVIPSRRRTILWGIPLLVLSLLALGPGTTRAELPGGIRVTAQVEPGRLQPGTKAELRVKVHLPSGWIVYDLEQVPNSVLPTSIELDSNEDIAPVETFRSEGAKEDIEPKFGSRIARFFDRTPTFRRPIIVAENARPGEHTLSGHIGFLVQQRSTKRFYVITKALFSTNLVVEIVKPSETTDSQPASTTGELPLSEATVTSLTSRAMKPPRPVGPAPKFAIQIDTRPSRISHPWTLTPKAIAWLIGIGLVSIGFIWGWMTPPYVAPTEPDPSFNWSISPRKKSPSPS